MTIQAQPDNLPETLNYKEQTFLALMMQSEDGNVNEVSRKMVGAGIYKHDKSACCLLRNPVVRTEYDNIKDIKRENASHLTLKSQLLTDRELNRIARLRCGSLDAKDERWVDRGFKASPPEMAQTNIQLNIEDRRRALMQRAQAVQAVGGQVLLKKDS